MNIKAKIQEAAYHYNWKSKIDDVLKNIDIQSIVIEKLEEYIDMEFDLEDLIEAALENAIVNTFEKIEIEEMLLEAIEENITAPW